MNRKNNKERSVTRSLQEYLRGIAGGLLFSLPLLYTMEVWWTGFTTHPLPLLIYVLATFTLLLAYNRYAGLRCDFNPVEVVIDSVEEMGLGLLIAAFFLWLIGQITTDMTVNEIVGKIIVEAMIVAIGVSVGTAQLGGGGRQETDSGMENEASQSDSSPAPFISSKGDFVGEVTVALCGAVLFAANVAPTEEIVVIATQITSRKLLCLAIVSMFLGALILFYSDFTGTQRFSHKGVKTVIFGTVVTYAIALVASAAILWFFGRFDNMSLIICLAETVVLGLAATLGASAGRLLLQ